MQLGEGGTRDSAEVRLTYQSVLTSDPSFLCCHTQVEASPHSAPKPKYMTAGHIYSTPEKKKNKVSGLSPTHWASANLLVLLCLSEYTEHLWEASSSPSTKAPGALSWEQPLSTTRWQPPELKPHRKMILLVGENKTPNPKPSQCVALLGAPAWSRADWASCPEN